MNAELSFKRPKYPTVYHNGELYITLRGVEYILQEGRNRLRYFRGFERVPRFIGGITCGLVCKASEVCAYVTAYYSLPRYNDVRERLDALT